MLAFKNAKLMFYAASVACIVKPRLQNKACGTNVNAITQFIKTIGAARIAAMGAVATGMIGFFIYLMMQSLYAVHVRPVLGSAI